MTHCLITLGLVAYITGISGAIKVCMDNVIRIGCKPSELTGIGLEYLAVNGMIIARFFDGNLITAMPCGNSNKTAIAA